MTSITGEQEAKGLPSTIFDKIGVPTLAGWAVMGLLAFAAFGTRLGILENQKDPRLDVLASKQEDDRKRLESLERNQAEVLRLLGEVSTIRRDMTEMKADMKDLRRDVTGRTR